MCIAARSVGRRGGTDAIACSVVCRGHNGAAAPLGSGSSDRHVRCATRAEWKYSKGSDECSRTHGLRPLLRLTRSMALGCGSEDKESTLHNCACKLGIPARLQRRFAAFAQPRPQRLCELQADTARDDSCRRRRGVGVRSS